MKKHVADLPLEVVTRAFQMATRDTAANAVAAGRVVVGIENGMLTEYDSAAGRSNEPTGRKADWEVAKNGN
jgi:hypothetical protein